MIVDEQYQDTDGNSKSNEFNTSKRRKGNFNDEFKIAKESLRRSSDMIKKTWTIYKTSPLYSFSYEESAFAQYTTELTSFISNETSTSINLVKCAFNLLPMDDRSAFNSLSVIISLGESQEVTKTTVYIVLSSIVMHYTNITQFILFSIFAKGPIALTLTAFQWFQIKFDCKISQMHLPSQFLTKNIINCIENEQLSASDTRMIELTYSLPGATANSALKSISLTIAVKALTELYNAFKNAKIDPSEGNNFLEAIEKHFFIHFRIHLSAFTLIRVGTPLLLMGKEGRIKILDAKQLHILLGDVANLAPFAKEQLIKI